jgi:hypothetical protein
MGDWAMIKIDPKEEVLSSGYFDEAWLHAETVEP